MFNCFTTVAEQLNIRTPSTVWFCILFLIRGVAVTSLELLVVNYNINGYTFWNLSQNATGFKPLLLTCWEITQETRNVSFQLVWLGYCIDMLSYSTLYIEKMLSIAEAFSRISINLPKQKLDLIKINNLNKSVCNNFGK